VTLLFTDVESSTQRWQDDPEGMAVSLAAHDAVLEGCIGAGGGRVFKHTGDGVCAVFESATRAVAAAVDAQRALELPVRMGLHTGEAEERDGDFFGTTLNRCARIMDAGHGGQVLVSAVTNALLDGADRVDLGQYVLKGLAQPERIFQVGAGDFPALRSPRRASSLPTPLTSLVGRDDLVADVVARLRDARLVTLVGVGGVGKTRVALAAAEQVVAAHDLAVFVGLSEVSDEKDVVAAVARAFGISSPTMDAIGVALSGRRVLVVLDNCEHVLDAVADVVEEILELSPTSRVLATSREGLALDGEHLVAVPGLDALDDGSSAVALFVDRARTADASFFVRDGEHTLVEEICRRLDGLPLAIELAAARVGVLSLPDLLGRLDERFNVLTGGRRRRTRDRQRTLRETVDWSYRLLEADEQRTFATLSVFAGSFGLDGAAAVLDGFDAADVLDLIEALAAKSMITVADVEGFRRYRYLETLRSYAEERLVERGDASSVLLRLHQHLRTVVVDAVEEIQWRTNRGATRLRIEIPNLRRALDDALNHGDVGAAAALIVPLNRLNGAIDWHVSGWASEVLALDGASGSAYEPDLLALHGMDRWLDDDLGGLHRLAEQMLERAAALGTISEDVEVAAIGFFQVTGDDAAVARLSAAHPPDGERPWPLVKWRRRTILLWTQLVPARPQPGVELELDADGSSLLEEMLREPAELTRGWGLAMSALRAQRAGDPDEMLARIIASEQLLVEGSMNWFGSLQIRGWAEWELGRLGDAIRTADRDLDHAYRHGDRSAMIIPLTIYALVLQSLEEAETAATVRGRLPRRLTVLLVAQLADLDRWLDDQLDDARRAEFATRGRAMDPRELQALTHTVASRHIQLRPSDP